MKNKGLIQLVVFVSLEVAIMIAIYMMSPGYPRLDPSEGILPPAFHLETPAVSVHVTET